MISQGSCFDKTVDRKGPNNPGKTLNWTATQGGGTSPLREGEDTVDGEDQARRCPFLRQGKRATALATAGCASSLAIAWY